MLTHSWLVANTLFLGFWTSSTIHGFSQGDYMGTYAALGVGSGIFSMALSFTVGCVSAADTEKACTFACVLIASWLVLTAS